MAGVREGGSMVGGVVVGRGRVERVERRLDRRVRGLGRGVGCGGIEG